MENNFFVVFLVASLSYLIGCIPFSYLIVKKVSGINLADTGTGNLGAMNSYEVTNNKSVGIWVMILDLLKGVVPVLLFSLVFESSKLVFLAGISVVIGHNFNVFMKFKGGRGLAPAAGTSLVINPILLVSWGILWLGGYYIVKKQIHIANSIATLFTPFLIFYTPAPITDKLNTFASLGRWELIIYSLVISLVILIRHIKPLMELIRSEKTELTNEENDNNQ